MGITDKEVVVSKEYVEKKIPLQERPKPVNFPPVDWYVSSENSQMSLEERVQKDTGATVTFAITPRGYENLAIGIAEMRRYIKQQDQIITYYEKAITGDEEQPQQ